MIFNSCFHCTKRLLNTIALSVLQRQWCMLNEFKTWLWNLKSWRNFKHKCQILKRQKKKKRSFFWWIQLQERSYNKKKGKESNRKLIFNRKFKRKRLEIPLLRKYWRNIWSKNKFSKSKSIKNWWNRVKIFNFD